jgi:asparagine N-glycosylation enzyme membrane subunit Stt3
LGAWSGKEADRGKRLIYLLVAGAFTALAAGAWYALAFVVRPFA